MKPLLLRKIALESGLTDVDVRSQRSLRFPFVSAIWPTQAVLRWTFEGDFVLTARRS
jgi:hypothetical protein